MSTMRAALLESLLALGPDLDVTVERLREFPWDSDELVQLGRGHLISVLTRYVAGRVEGAQVESWAEAIECREDIAFEPGKDEVLRATVHELANPELCGPLSVSSASQLLLRLQ